MDRFKTAMDAPHPALHMPERNEYIPTKFEQKPRESVKRLSLMFGFAKAYFKSCIIYCFRVGMAYNSTTLRLHVKVN